MERHMTYPREYTYLKRHSRIKRSAFLLLRNESSIACEYLSRNKSNKPLRFAPGYPLQAPFFRILLPSERDAGVGVDLHAQDMIEDSEKSLRVHSNR
eukprot:scaffold2027_cov148-Skeletonema_marinoi.AAC.15